MLPTQHATGTTAYRPTSLDFINLPNPIEPTQPQAGAPKHPLNSIPRLDKARLDSGSNQDLFKLILDPAAERLPERQKSLENTSLDLPRLPVRNAAKRLRIPPTLSGLHHPPPDAGLLPSISVEQLEKPPPRQQDSALLETSAKVSGNQPAIQPDAGQDLDLISTTSATLKCKDTADPLKKRTKRNKWTDEETAHLLKGVAKFGIGNWTKILNCPEYKFVKRSALDLKDRFRVCCPDHYKGVSSRKRASADSDRGNRPSLKYRSSCKPFGPPPQKVPPSKLKELGIDWPFSKSTRRLRHGYTSEEDDAILRGYLKYGNSWALIRQDASLCLSHRTSTDLRDRFRTKYPEEYAKAGLVSRPDKPTVVSKLSAEDELNNVSGTDVEMMSEPAKTNVAPAISAIPEIINKEDATTTKVSASKKSAQPSLFSLDDVFLGVPFGTDDVDSEPIILDRGILDWATTDTTKTALPDLSKNSGINPLMTLKLPKPVSSIATTVPAAPAAGSTPSNGPPPLRSLASLVPEIANPEQLELPSLMQWFDSVDNEGRGGSTAIPTLEELLP